MIDKDTYMQYIDEAVASLASRCGVKPQVGIVLGSGLGDLADRIESATVIPYSEIPHFKTSTASGHKGNLIFGTLGGKQVVAMQGRFHYYEGYTMQEVTFPIRVMARMGVKTLLVSNAAGAVNAVYRVGDLMVITDHVNLLPNPLVGPNLDAFGVRFPDMTTVYSKRLRAIAHEVAGEMGIALREGVYVAGTGPSYETLAEYRYYGAIGGDAAGMSTIPEVIVARHSGLEIFGMSVITNQSNDLDDEHLNDGNDVVIAAEQATEKLSNLFIELISRM